MQNMFNLKSKIMKKVFALMLLLATTVCFSSCSNEDEVPTVNYPSIIGTWHQNMGTSSGDYVSSSTDVYWTFRANNTATEKLDISINDYVISSTTVDFVYSYSGKYIDFSNDKTSFRYNVSVNGNKMTLGNEESGYFELTKQ